MTDVDGKTIMRDGNGRLFQVEPAQVETLQRDQGWQVAPENQVQERVAAREQYSKYGSTGQQAQALAEGAVRVATGGAVKGLGSEEDIRGRANVVRQESPILDAVSTGIPGAVNAVGVGVATGGLGFIPAIAAQAAMGGMGNVSLAADDAFRRDEELSSEAAWGSFGSGVLLGAAAEVGGIGLSKLARAGSNRFVEASGRAARRAEASAFEGAGIVRPAKDLAKAVDDPAVAASIRKTANEVRESVQAQVAETFDGLRAAEQAVRSAEPPIGSVVGDVAEQRAAARPLFDGLRNELRDMPFAQRAMEELSAANNPSAVFASVRNVRKAIQEAIDQTDDVALVKTLSKYEKQATQLEQSPGIFGDAGSGAAKRSQALQDLGDSRAAFEKALVDSPEYMRSVGTRGGKEIEEKLDVFADRLAALDPDSAVLVGQLRDLRSGPLEKVAAGNQVDALSATIKTDAPVKSPIQDILGEVAETAVESLVPGVGLVRKAWKYRKHILALSGQARQASNTTAAGLLARSPARAAERVSQAISSSRFESALKGGSRATAGLFHSGNTEDDYNQIKSAVEALSEDPGKLADSLAGEFGDLPNEAPDLFMGIAAQSHRAVAFLQTKLPPAFEFSLMYPDGPPPSRTDMIELSLYWNGATNPESVLASIGNGTAMPEEVEAFRAVCPVWFEDLRETTVLKVQEKARAGEPVGAYKIAELENLLDLHGQLDPTFGSSVAGVYAAVKAEQAEQTQAPSYIPPPKAGQRLSPEA